MKKIIFLILIFGFVKITISQNNKYWVMFKNKNGTPYSVSTPTAYLTAKSILRRTNQSITINSSDLPVTPSYVSQIAAVPSVTVLYRSKWLNGVVVRTNTTAIATINTFTFVNNTNAVNRFKIVLPVIEKNQPAPEVLNPNKTNNPASYNYGGAAWQEKMIGVDCMHNLGFRGQGMTIAIIDDGTRECRYTFKTAFLADFVLDEIYGVRLGNHSKRDLANITAAIEIIKNWK